MATQEFFGVKAQRGKVVRQRIPVGALGDGTPITLPVIAIGGKDDGPTMYFQGGLHGNEVTGIEVLRGMLARIDPGELRGTVVCVPIANPPAFITKTRGFALEERGPFDMNRIFPGTAKGVLSERIVHVLFNEFVLKADVVLDIHSALVGCNIHPFVYVDPADDEAGHLALRVRLAQAFGTDLAYYKKRGSKMGTSVMTGTMAAQAEIHKKPVLTFEMGESERISWSIVDHCVEGGLNMLREMGMLPGTAVLRKDQKPFSTIGMVLSDHAGLFHPKVALGQAVKKGQPLAEVVDPWSDEKHAYVSPNDGTVLRIMLNSPVMTGAELFWVVW